MPNKILIDAFRREVEEVKENFHYPKLGDAFAHFAVSQLFDLDDNDAFQFCLIGVGGREKGIDAFVPEDMKRRVNIVQAKYSEKKLKKSTRLDFEDLRSAYDWLNIPQLDQRGLKDELLRVLDRYRQYKQLGYHERLVLLFFGEPGPDSKSQLEILRKSLRCEVDAIYDNELLAKWVDRSEVYREKGPNVEISSVFKPTLLKMKGLPRSIICHISGEELAKWVRKYPFEIFQINVRYYLGKGNPVNKKLARTLDKPTERKYFWYYNLGINAICDFFRPRGKKISFRNLRIVNGAQTCNTLLANPSKLQNVMVMLRVFETKNLELATRIAISNNTQSPVKGRDLFSENPEQIELQKQFGKLKPPIFYERKRKEWDSLWRNKRKDALRYLDGKTKRLVDNETCAQGMMALKLGMPAEAKAQKKDIFTAEEFGGFYEKIFSPETTAYELLVGYRILTLVDEKSYQFMRTYKRAVETNFQGIKAREANDLRKTLEFLPHSNTQITALFGVVFENKYGEHYDFRKIYQLAYEHADTLEKIYEWLVGQLFSHIDNVKAAFESQGKSFNARNYLLSSGAFESLSGQIAREIKFNKQIIDLLPS